MPAGATLQELLQPCIRHALAVPAPGWRVCAVGGTHPTFLSRHVVLERA